MISFFCYRLTVYHIFQYRCMQRMCRKDVVLNITPPLLVKRLIAVLSSEKDSRFVVCFVVFNYGEKYMCDEVFLCYEKEQIQLVSHTGPREVGNFERRTNTLALVST